MKKFLKITSLVLLILSFSSCTKQTPISPSIDNSLEMVNKNSIKTIPDINSIAFEWQRVQDPRVIGYNIYRSELTQNSSSLKLIKTIKDKYSSHFVDTKLKANTKYAYQISAISPTKESNSTDAYIVSTLSRINAIGFIQAVSNLPKKIKITWKPHNNQRIKYYEIQKLNTVLNSWEKLSKVQNRLQAEYIDKNLANAETRTYRVIAYDLENTVSAPSKEVSATTKSLPQSPTYVVATNHLAKQIRLSWEASTTKDVVKYVIYRSPFSTLGFTKLKEVAPTTRGITDFIKKDGKKYFYKVYAVDKDGLLSNQNISSTQGQTLEKPKAPIITLAQIQGNKAILRWVSPDKRAVAYNILKTPKINFLRNTTTKYTNVSQDYFEDVNIQNGIKYEYSIEAIDKNGLVSKQSDTKILKKFNPIVR
ncbi:MAG: hypothetical protein CSA86_05245 [Arcobacter sp.]|nr:MAG: hypothetical protein CSA86_05245 [Arcobacter sp.]